MGKIKETKIQPETRRWGYLAVSGLGLLFVGIIYAWSVLKVPLAAAFPWTDAQLAAAYTVSMSFFCIGSLISGWCNNKIHFRYALWAGGAMILSGLILTSRLRGGIFGLYLTYGVLVGCGIGVAYNVLLATANAWFPDKKGTSSGLLMMCFGFSSLVLGKAAAALFDMEQIGWRKTYAGLGAAIFIILLVCSFLLEKPSAATPLPKASKRSLAKKAFAELDYAPGEMIVRPTFWIYYIYGILSAAVGSAVISFARELSISLGASVGFATTLVGALSVCNGLGRVLCGLAFDHLGRRKTMLLSGIVTVLAPALMLAAIPNRLLPLAVISLCLTGISYGTNPTISSALISSFYGMRDYAMNYSISNSKLMFSSFAAPVAAALLTATGGYLAPFALLTGLAVISLILCLFIRHP